MASTSAEQASDDGDGTAKPFAIERVLDAAGGVVLELSGQLSLGRAAELWEELGALVQNARSAQHLHFDMSRVAFVDGGAMALLAHLRTDLQQHGVTSEFVGASEHVQRIIHLYHGDLPFEPRVRRRPRGMLDQLGQATMTMLAELQLVLAFLGQMVVSAWSVMRAPRSANWKEIGPTMERAGADAVPIVLMINFLVGLVMAFQASKQLKQFGANVLVADLIGISMTRELGPLMTAIVVCGRSGAAFAAELGSMNVNEEIDALRTMGFGPMRFLVLPRTLGLVAVMPLLTIFADVMGVVGGMVVGTTHLGLSALGYVSQTRKVVHLWDFSSGLIKSALFGLVIALIACEQGLAARGGAEEVGRRTTSAVVAILFALIVVDAMFSTFFRMVGL